MCIAHLFSQTISSPPNALFFFNDTAPPGIYTLSLHDALPISPSPPLPRGNEPVPPRAPAARPASPPSPPSPQALDRKSTRLNSSHPSISYAVFCLKKKNHTPRKSCRKAEPYAPAQPQPFAF